MASRFLFISPALLVLVSLAFAHFGREVHGGNGVFLPPPPLTKVEPVTETLHGKKITDDYRWLEDGQSPETRAWIASQMEYTEKYLSQVKIRPEIARRLSELQRVETIDVPAERNGKFFFTKRLPDENQASIYLRDGLRSKDERLIDATRMSADQNTSVDIYDISENGGLLVYAVRVGGADEASLHVFNVAKRQDLADVLPSARYSGVSFSPGNHGLYYAKLIDHGSAVYYHEFGATSEDPMIFGEKVGDEILGPMELIGARVTENNRYLLITVSHGVPAKRVDIYARDLRTPDAPIQPIIHGI